MPGQDVNETELARRAAEGDAAAFSDLYRLNRDRVYAFAYRMIRVQAISEEITQEAFLVLIQHPERYDAARGSILTFLCAIARNQILYYLRQNRREFETEGEQMPTGENQPAGNKDPLRELLAEELDAEIRAAINALPLLQREVIVLREFEGLSYKEIAMVVGAETNVVKVRLHRARQSLTRRLAPYVVSLGDNCYELR